MKKYLSGGFHGRIFIKKHSILGRIKKNEGILW
jgi:hypothetical protein